MSELVTDAMVEAAARTEWTHERHIRPWEKAPDDLADHCRGCSRHTLEAAAPAIAAKALRDAAEVWQTGGWADDIPKGATRPAVVLGMAQRATNWVRARADRIERGES